MVTLATISKIRTSTPERPGVPVPHLAPPYVGCRQASDGAAALRHSASQCQGDLPRAQAGHRSADGSLPLRRGSLMSVDRGKVASCPSSEGGWFLLCSRSRSVRSSRHTCCRSVAVSYTHLRAHETDSYLVCRLLLE